MISTATLRYMRISPRKVRPVIALVKGKKADDAISALHGIKKKASALLIDVISSAISNAKRVPGIDLSDLYISSLIANGGPQMKRFRAASMGRAGTIRKRTSHITVELDTLANRKPSTSDRTAVEVNRAASVKASAKAYHHKEDQAIKKHKAKEPVKPQATKKGKE